VVLNKLVLDLTVLSLLAAICCVAAASLQVENFPVLFGTLGLLAAISALRALPDEFNIATCLLRAQRLLRRITNFGKEH
jgi:hypothetical protein